MDSNVKLENGFFIEVATTLSKHVYVKLQNVSEQCEKSSSSSTKKKINSDFFDARLFK